MENLCLAMRDFVLGRIGGTLGTGESTSEKDDRRLIAEYLIMSLNDYVQNECVAPELGKAFSDKSDNETGTQNVSTSSQESIEMNDTKEISYSGGAKKAD